jgi:hypothetical protein
MIYVDIGDILGPPGLAEQRKKGEQVENKSLGQGGIVDKDSIRVLGNYPVETVTETPR